MVTGFIILAAVAAAVASMILGGLWYGPLFGKIWMRFMGWNPSDTALMKKMKKKMVGGYIGMFASNLVMAVALFFIILFTQAFSYPIAIMIAGIIWLGFQVPITMGDQLWGGKPWGLFWMNIGFQAIHIVAVAVIVVAFLPLIFPVVAAPVGV